MTASSPRWKEEELSPAEALRDTIFRAMLTSTHRNGPKGKPGEIIGRMPERYRKALRHLHAEDIQDVRTIDTQDFG